MGKLVNNNVMATARGKVGYVVFKKVNGSMVAANLRDRDSNRSRTTPQELQARRFKRASRYAKTVKDPALTTKKYTVDPRGIEHILDLCTENWWVGDRESFTMLTPATYNIDAVEDSDVLLTAKGIKLYSKLRF